MSRGCCGKGREPSTGSDSSGKQRVEGTERGTERTEERGDVEGRWKKKDRGRRRAGEGIEERGKETRREEERKEEDWIEEEEGEGEEEEKGD